VAGEHVAAPVQIEGVDLLILDSTRTFLSSLTLNEDSSDDFAKFSNRRARASALIYLIV